MGADMTKVRALVLVAALGFGTAGCSDDGSAAELPPPLASLAPDAVGGPTPDPTPAASTEASPASADDPEVAATVATGLESPWGLALLPDGSALVSERDSGRIKRIAKAGAVSTVGIVPGVRHEGESGLLGITVAKNFAAEPLLYAYLTTDSDNRIVRMAYAEDGLGKPEVLLEGLKRASFHDGGRLAFGPDGMLYAGTGDAGMTGLSQDPDSRNGKILRMTPEGKVPADNPTKGSLVFSMGHRNVQGLAFDDRGRLWASEFGQNTFDELNLIEAGKNYGWPVVEGIDPDADAKYTNPQRTWATDNASPSGIAIAGGSVWMAALKGTKLWEIPLSKAGAKEATGKPVAWFDGKFGRLRTVMAAPDGSLWLITSNTDGRGDVRKGDDRILRITI